MDSAGCSTYIAGRDEWKGQHCQLSKRLPARLSGQLAVVLPLEKLLIIQAVSFRLNLKGNLSFCGGLGGAGKRSAELALFGPPRIRGNYYIT